MKAMQALADAYTFAVWAHDPYSKWEVHYTGVMMDMSIAALMPHDEKWDRRWKRLQAKRWIAVHYLRERSLRSQRYLPDRCQA